MVKFYLEHPAIFKCKSSADVQDLSKTTESMRMSCSDLYRVPVKIILQNCSQLRLKVCVCVCV